MLLLAGLGLLAPAAAGEVLWAAGRRRREDRWCVCLQGQGPARNVMSQGHVGITIDDIAVCGRTRDGARKQPMKAPSTGWRGDLAWWDASCARLA